MLVRTQGNQGLKSAPPPYLTTSLELFQNSWKLHKSTVTPKI